MFMGFNGMVMGFNRIVMGFDALLTGFNRIVMGFNVFFSLHLMGFSLHPTRISWPLMPFHGTECDCRMLIGFNGCSKDLIPCS